MRWPPLFPNAFLPLLLPSRHCFASPTRCIFIFSNEGGYRRPGGVQRLQEVGRAATAKWEPRQLTHLLPTLVSFSFPLRQPRTWPSSPSIQSPPMTLSHTAPPLSYAARRRLPPLPHPSIRRRKHGRVIWSSRGRRTSRSSGTRATAIPASPPLTGCHTMPLSPSLAAVSACPPPSPALAASHRRERGRREKGVARRGGTGGRGEKER